MSGTLLSEDAIVRGLIAQGVPREKALRQAQSMGVRPHAPTAQPDAEPAPAIAWPVRLLLPWSYLVSDNDRQVAKLITADGQPKAIRVLTAEYRAALEKIANLARNKVGDAAAVAAPLAIRVLVWVPNNTAHNDIANFCKLVHDALEDVIYTNDTWLHDIHWTRAGIDVDAPRAEIILSPIEP
jgi:Holliday junction resolvase RusA-like endonuclease